MTNEKHQIHLDHFLSVSRKEVISAREALLDADAGRLGELVSRVASLDVVRLIVDTASTSLDYFNEMFERIERAGPGMKIIAGLSIAGAGAILWGAEFALAPIIAFGLILYGILIALPAAIELVSMAANDMYESILKSLQSD